MYTASALSSKLLGYELISHQNPFKILPLQHIQCVLRMEVMATEYDCAVINALLLLRSLGVLVALHAFNFLGFGKGHYKEKGIWKEIGNKSIFSSFTNPFFLSGSKP